MPDEYVDGALFTESDSESEVDEQISQLLSEIIENDKLPRTKTKNAKTVARTEKETSGNNSEKLFPGKILKTTEPNEKFPERDRNNAECGNLDSASPPLTKHNLLNEGGNCLKSDNSDEEDGEDTSTEARGITLGNQLNIIKKIFIWPFTLYVQ